MYFYQSNKRALGQCLEDIVTVGSIDTKSVGCVASDVVLYLPLVFIIGVVATRFVIAVMFAWCFSWKLGIFKIETVESPRLRTGPLTPTVLHRMTTGRTSRRKGWQNNREPEVSSPLSQGSLPPTICSKARGRRLHTENSTQRLTSVVTQPASTVHLGSRALRAQCVPQPPPDPDPFGFPLAHMICLTTDTLNPKPV